MLTRPRRLGALVITAFVIPALAIMTGPSGVVAVSVAGATVVVLVRWLRADRRNRRDLVDLIAGLRLLAREVRTGVPAEVAAGNAATAAHGSAVPVLGGLGHERGPAPGLPDPRSPAGEVARRVAVGWMLARYHGLAVTPIVDAAVRDAEQQLSAHAERASQVAGPRMSGYVMSALPLVGLLLGTAMDADPLHVLTGTDIGRLLLAVGVVLICGGLVWSARIVRS